MIGSMNLKSAALASALALCAAVAPLAAHAQAGGPGAPPQGAPKAVAPFDMAGNWVSIVNEDWRWRMITPPKGDYPGVPLTKAGQDAANAWDPATDGSCKAFGVGGLMRQPTRLRIGWESDTVIKIETDNGQQTRRLIFGQRPEANTPKTLQGFSAAQWQFPNLVPAQVAGGIQVGNAYRPPGGSLMVRTTNTTGGWVRKNGVPYSENAVIVEYFDQFKGPDGAQWLTVLTVVNDPVNFNGPYMTSSHFRKEADGSKWNPKPCKT